MKFRIRLLSARSASPFATATDPSARPPKRHRKYGAGRTGVRQHTTSGYSQHLRKEERSEKANLSINIPRDEGRTVSGWSV